MSGPRELSNRIAERRDRRRLSGDDGYIRQTFTEPRAQARKTARSFFDQYPKQAYMSEVESWRELPGDLIEFTMRRLPSSD